MKVSDLSANNKSTKDQNWENTNTLPHTHLLVTRSSSCHEIFGWRFILSRNGDFRHRLFAYVYFKSQTAIKNHECIIKTAYSYFCAYCCLGIHVSKIIETRIYVINVKVKIIIEGLVGKIEMFKSRCRNIFMYYLI